MATDPTIFGFQAGDAATWAGAVMSALAVVAALGISLWSDAQRRKSEEGNAKFAAALLYTNATELLMCLVRLRDGAENLGLIPQAPFGLPSLNNVQTSAQALTKASGTLATEHARMLPSGVAEDLAMTMGMVVRLGQTTATIAGNAAKVQTISTDFTVSVVDNCNVAIENMCRYFTYCEKNFRAESHKKFLNREDHAH